MAKNRAVAAQIRKFRKASHLRWNFHLTRLEIDYW